jgi:N-glycosylase/DNA lyase
METSQTYKFSSKDFDLEKTLTCGQTFCWNRINGKLYQEEETSAKDIFYTFKNGKPVLAKTENNQVIVETTCSSRETVQKALGLEHNLDNIFDSFPHDKKLEKAKKELYGLRIIQDDFFPCLISYLLSPQMRIPRIKKMYNSIAEKYGEEIEFQGRTLNKFPTQEQLSEASEEELRELGVGYRAKYIVETVKILDEEDFNEYHLREISYLEAKEKILELYGVGDKVADCVLLFSLGHLEAYPIDTWAEKAIKQHYPDLHTEKYEELSQKMREYFGPYSGYAQEYLFHAARQDIIEV